MSNSGKLVQKALAYIEKISADCGWDNINSLKNLFHKATGKSMREWRASPA